MERKRTKTNRNGDPELMGPGAVADRLSASIPYLDKLIDHGKFPRPDIEGDGLARKWLRVTVETWIANGGKGNG